MMTFFAIYGFVVITTFISSVIILNWGAFDNKIAVTMNFGRAAFLSVAWPITVILLFFSLLNDWFPPKGKKDD